MVGGEGKGQGGERENTGMEVVAVVVGRVGLGGGGGMGWGLHSQHHWLPPRWSFTDSHSPNPSWQPLGQAHLIQMHTHIHTQTNAHTNKCTPIQTHLPPPRGLNSLTHRKWTEWCG